MTPSEKDIDREIEELANSRIQQTIWMNPPLTRALKGYYRKMVKKHGVLKTNYGRAGNFSGELGDIVGRYELIISTTPVPQLTDDERAILIEATQSSALSAGSDYGSSAKTALRMLPDAIMDCEVGTLQSRSALRDKVSGWSAAERLAVLDNLGY